MKSDDMSPDGNAEDVELRRYQDFEVEINLQYLS